MTQSSHRLALPYIAPSQAQKHVTHNEALRQLDRVVQLVLSGQGTLPPTAPLPGEIHSVTAGATGAWAGQDGKLAVAEDGAWVFIEPGEGWLATQPDNDLPLIHRSGVWSPVAWPTDNLGPLGVNTTADTTNRLSVASDAVLFSHDGAGHQLKVNKAAASDTASLLFQSNWSGRAEMGLAGGDDFTVKVSADGSAWTEALKVVAAGGEVQMARARVTDVLALPPRAEPSAPATGDLYFDASLSKLRCYDGSLWQDLF